MRPGGVEACDGKRNDCRGAGWPALLDDDHDGDAAIDPCPDGVTVGCDDNCPFARNPGQRDRNGDGIGDACDPEDGNVVGDVAEVTLESVPMTGGGSAFEPLAIVNVHSLNWQREVGALSYNVYAGTILSLRDASYGSCYRNRIVRNATRMDHAPAPGSGCFYVVAPVLAEGEGTLGDRSNFTERTVSEACP